jgi:hypothetical protein
MDCALRPAFEAVPRVFRRARQPRARRDGDKIEVRTEALFAGFTNALTRGPVVIPPGSAGGFSQEI